jgi:hypothetical protein
MVLLGDEAPVGPHFGLFRESANLDAREVHGLQRKYHGIKNPFGHTQWNSSVTWVIWNLLSLRLEIVLVSMQDRCTVCPERTIASEIILDTPDGTPR